MDIADTVSIVDILYVDTIYSYVDTIYSYIYRYN